MSASKAGGAAHDAEVVAVDNAPGRTPQQQAYLDNVADEAEKAVGVVEKMIEDLYESLTDRKAEAERARAEADNGRVENGVI